MRETEKLDEEKKNGEEHDGLKVRGGNGKKKRSQRKGMGET